MNYLIYNKWTLIVIPLINILSSLSTFYSVLAGTTEGWSGDRFPPRELSPIVLHNENCRRRNWVLFVNIVALLSRSAVRSETNNQATATSRKRCIAAKICDSLWDFQIWIHRYGRTKSRNDSGKTSPKSAQPTTIEQKTHRVQNFKQPSVQPLTVFDNNKEHRRWRSGFWKKCWWSFSNMYMTYFLNEFN